MQTDLNERLIPDNVDDDAGNIDFKQIFNNEYNIDDRSEKYYLEHCKSPEYLAQIFRTDLKNGLNSKNKADLEWREKKWGNYHLPPEE